MGVNVGRGAQVRMTQSVLNLFQAKAIGKQHGGGSVTQVVEAEAVHLIFVVKARHILAVGILLAEDDLVYAV